MALTATFWNWLTTPRGRERGGAAPARRLQEPAPLDVDRLTRELDLLAEAQRLGAAGLPEASARGLSGPEALVVSHAVALLVGSPLSRAIGNFYLGFNRPTVPTRIFNAEAAALEWLQTFSSKAA